MLRLSLLIKLCDALGEKLWFKCYCISHLISKTENSALFLLAEADYYLSVQGLDDSGISRLPDLLNKVFYKCKLINEVYKIFLYLFSSIDGFKYLNFYLKDLIYNKIHSYGILIKFVSIIKIFCTQII